VADKKNTPEEAPTVDVDALLQQLTKKNDEYVFKLRRILSEHQYTEAQQRQLLASMLPEMVEAQRQGKPATQLYGPVTVKADSLINAPKPKKKVPFWLSGIDLSLFFISIFALIYGIMAYIRPKQMTGASGIASLLLMAIAAGFIFTYYNQWTHKPKKERPKTWLLMLAGVALVMLASIASSSLALLKSPLTNPSPWPVYLGLAVVSYGAHWYLKRRYQLDGIMAMG
jgi:uncharacterized membrane-anchored protein